MGLARNQVHGLYEAIAKARPDETWWRAHFRDDEGKFDWVLLDGDSKAEARDG